MQICEASPRCLCSAICHRPYLLQAKSSYTQLGVFSIATYPYSFKLFWSPIVDTIYSGSYGRRKSWIVPIQTTTAIILALSAEWVQKQVEDAHVVNITYLFFGLVLLVATQDIAVDGWALTMLKPRNVGYASTCQTVGMNIGYFTSFTVFLALNDPSFCNSYLRSEPKDAGVIELGAYLRAWGVVFGLVTALVAFVKREKKGAEEEEQLSLLDAYHQLWAILQLRPVLQLSAVLLTMRLGILAAEGASALKLLEKGVSKESLAVLVLIDFPCELASAVLAGRWASHSKRPLDPWMVGMWIRLGCGFTVTYLVSLFPTEGDGVAAATPFTHPGLFMTLAGLGLLTSFSSTLMFTAVGSFYNRISDPEMGGTYLTLLNTIANMGIVLPKLGMFWLMDQLTVTQCISLAGPVLPIPCSVKKAAGDPTISKCERAGGECRFWRDGFFPLSYGLLLLGFVLALIYRRYLPQLQSLPLSYWRVSALKKS